MLRDQTFFQCLCQLVQVNNMHSSVGIEDNVSQQIGNDQGIVLRTAGVFYNIAVPVQQRPVMTVELADLEPSFR